MTNLSKLKIIAIATILIIATILWQVFLLFADRMGDIAYLIALFPFAANWANIFLEEITPFMLALAFFQFPIYAIIIAFAKSRKMVFAMLASILVVHALAIAVFHFFKQ